MKKRVLRELLKKREEEKNKPIKIEEPKVKLSRKKKEEPIKEVEEEEE